MKIKIVAEDITDTLLNAVEVATTIGKLYVPIKRQDGCICPDNDQFVIHEFGTIVEWSEIDCSSLEPA